MTFNGDDDGYFTDELEKQLREGPQVIPPGEGQQMSDLRSACIEAMADAWARLEEGEDYEMSGVAWANLRAVAAVQLDALLGVLEDHADEWPPDRGGTYTRELLAVLREDT